VIISFYNALDERVVGGVPHFYLKEGVPILNSDLLRTMHDMGHAEVGK
jgi:hypothetical protein